MVANPRLHVLVYLRMFLLCSRDLSRDIQQNLCRSVQRVDLSAKSILYTIYLCFIQTLVTQQLTYCTRFVIRTHVSVSFSRSTMRQSKKSIQKCSSSCQEFKNYCICYNYSFFDSYSPNNIDCTRHIVVRNHVRSRTRDLP